MDVLAVAEGVDEDRVLGHVGEQAQLDLRVIGDYQLPAFAGDEGGADFAAELGLDGDVLQVGIGGRQAAGGRAGLVETGVETAGGGIDQGGQRVDVGAFEFGELAVFEHFADDS